MWGEELPTGTGVFGFYGQCGQAKERGGWGWRGRTGCLADGSDFPMVPPEGDAQDC